MKPSTYFLNWRVKQRVKKLGSFITYFVAGYKSFNNTWSAWFRLFLHMFPIFTSMTPALWPPDVPKGLNPSQCAMYTIILGSLLAYIGSWLNTFLQLWQTMLTVLFSRTSREAICEVQVTVIFQIPLILLVFVSNPFSYSQNENSYNNTMFICGFPLVENVPITKSNSFKR